VFGVWCRVGAVGEGASGPGACARRCLTPLRAVPPNTKSPIRTLYFCNLSGAPSAAQSAPRAWVSGVLALETQISGEGQRPVVDALLLELVQSLGVLPDNAQQIRELNELSDEIRRIVNMAVHLGMSWACWRDDRRQLWLFVAEMWLPRSRELGVPVLQLDQYGGPRAMNRSGTWFKAGQGQWERGAD
jgi:hypothetical protein